VQTGMQQQEVRPAAANKPAAPLSERTKTSRLE
jgi:hypothetical protein